MDKIKIAKELVRLAKDIVAAPPLGRAFTEDKARETLVDLLIPKMKKMNLLVEFGWESDEPYSSGWNITDKSITPERFSVKIGWKEFIPKAGIHDVLVWGDANDAPVDLPREVGSMLRDFDIMGWEPNYTWFNSKIYDMSSRDDITREYKDTRIWMDATVKVDKRGILVVFKIDVDETFDELDDEISKEPDLS